MEWWLVLGLIFGSLFVLMAAGMPVAFCFLVVDAVWVYLLWGGSAGLELLCHSLFDSVNTFTLVAVPLFVLMGDVLFRSGLGPNIIGALDKCLGRLPGRLSLVAVATGTILAALTGASMASVAMLGSVLVPEMERRGYREPMSLGPILGAGGLAIMIPPSSLAVILAALGEFSVAETLVGIVIPGLLMAVLYGAYIIGRCFLQPSIAPAYEVASIPLLEKMRLMLRDILPLGLIVFLVTGVIIVGIATPSEAAATGTLGTVVLVACYRRLTRKVVKEAVLATIGTTIMMFMIILAATAFSQVLAFSGASRGLVQFAISFASTPVLAMVLMQAVVLLLGCFIGPVAIMMITLPIFMPLVRTLGLHPVWFGVIYLINIETGGITPPYGMSLFVMKGVVPSASMTAISLAGMPYVALNIIAMALIFFFPEIALWLPTVMR